MLAQNKTARNFFLASCASSAILNTKYYLISAKAIVFLSSLPRQNIHLIPLQHHVPNSQQEGTFVMWNCFFPHPLPVSTAWLHTHTMSNTVGSAVPALYLYSRLLWHAVSYSHTLETNHDVLRSVPWDAGKPLLMCYRITCSHAAVVLSGSAVPVVWSHTLHSDCGSGE